MATQVVPTGQPQAGECPCSHLLRASHGQAWGRALCTGALCVWAQASSPRASPASSCADGKLKHGGEGHLQEVADVGFKRQ